MLDEEVFGDDGAIACLPLYYVISLNVGHGGTELVLHGPNDEEVLVPTCPIDQDHADLDDEYDSTGCLFCRGGACQRYEPPLFEMYRFLVQVANTLHYGCYRREDESYTDFLGRCREIRNEQRERKSQAFWRKLRKR